MALFVKNIPEQLDQEALYQQFSQFGQCKISYFVNFTQGRFAFVDYETKIQGQNAIDTFNDKCIHGQTLNVKWSGRANGNQLNQKPRSRSRSPVNTQDQIVEQNQQILTQKSDDQEEVKEEIIEENKEEPSSLQSFLNELPSPQFKSPILMELPKPELPSKVEELPKIQAQIKQQLPPMKIPAYMFGIDCMAALVKGHKIQGIDGSIFIVEKIRSKDEDTSLVRCTKCNRLIQKKSIPSHINSRVHQLYVERETS